MQPRSVALAAAFRPALGLQSHIRDARRFLAEP